MSDIKYRINLGNCENEINADLLGETVIEDFRADSTIHFADNTEITASYSF